MLVVAEHITPAVLRRELAKVVPSEEIERHLGLVRLVLLDIGHRELEDTDFFQDGCVGLWKAIQTYTPDRGAFSTWACKIIRNAIYRGHRDRVRQQRIVCEGGKEDELLQREEAPPLPQHLLDQFLASQPDDSEVDKEDRRLLIAHYLDEKSAAQLGRELGISREYARQRINRALKRIQIRFQDVIEGADDE